MRMYTYAYLMNLERWVYYDLANLCESLGQKRGWMKYIMSTGSVTYRFHSAAVSNVYTRGKQTAGPSLARSLFL